MDFHDYLLLILLNAFVAHFSMGFMIIARTNGDEIIIKNNLKLPVGQGHPYDNPRMYIGKLCNINTIAQGGLSPLQTTSFTHRSFHLSDQGETEPLSNLSLLFMHQSPATQVG